MKRTIVIVCVLALLAGSLFASGQQEQKKAAEKKGPVKMIIFADIMAPVFEHLFERFEKETGYPMEIEALTAKTYKQVVASRLITKEVPDLIVNHGTPYMYLAMNPKENLVDLTAWTAENLTGKLLTKDFVSSFALDGKTYGVPFTGITARAFFYNKKVMNAAGVSIPKNWHDFYDNVAPKIKAAGYTPIYGMGGDKWAIGFEAENYVADSMIATGVELKINGKKATFHDTDFQKAFEMQLKVKNAGFYNEDVIMGTYDGAVKSLADGESFMTDLSVVCCTRFTDEVMQHLGGFGLSKETNRIYFGMPNCAYIPKDAKNMEGAKTFINWFIKRENLQKFYGELKMITPYMGIEAEMYPVAADFKKGFDAVTPYCPQLLAAIPQVGTYVAPMIAGEKKPYDIVEEMQQDFAKNAKAAGLPAYQ